MSRAPAKSKSAPAAPPQIPVDPPADATKNAAIDVEVRMLVSMAGPVISLAPGDIHRCGAAEAGRLIAAGFAASVAETH